MTTEDIIKLSRRFLQDTDDGHYHWTDDELKENVKLAIRELNNIRPETRYVDGALVDGVTLPDDATAEIDLDDRFTEAIADYVAHLCYLDDVTDPVSAQLAEVFLNKFTSRAQA